MIESWKAWCLRVPGTLTDTDMCCRAARTYAGRCRFHGESTCNVRIFMLCANSFVIFVFHAVVRCVHLHEKQVLGGFALLDATFFLGIADA